jgi:hypothetical protein
MQKYSETPPFLAHLFRYFLQQQSYLENPFSADSRFRRRSRISSAFSAACLEEGTYCLEYFWVERTGVAML